ncbi:MAG: 50S ribosomal protein L25 [Candidatus Colwellbacteria bacterium]|nr:50S ribosomal protein L25 [Candidatus Colwellbacteria bacterium]
MITLKAEKREIFGKKVNKLRKQGLIPAELYGRGISNLHLSLSEKDFAKVYEEAGEHSVLSLEVEGRSHPVLIHDVEENPLGRTIFSVDFYEVKMDEKVKAHVPLEFEGEAPAVKEKEGILVKSMDEIEVEALPADLPSSIKVDLTRLNELDESLYVKDLSKSDKYEYMVDGETVVVSVTAPKEEEFEEVAPPAEGEAVAAPEEGEPKEEDASEGESKANETEA